MELPGEEGVVARVDLVHGRLAGTVFAHAIDARDRRLDCWYASQGLRSYGQKELLLTLVHPPDEPPGAVFRG